MALSTEKIDRHKWKDYFEKATQFYRGMLSEILQQRWETASLDGIHCAISAADALTTCHLGERSRGQDHRDAVQLLVKTRLPNSDEKCKQFLQILDRKNNVEYLAELTPESQAKLLAQQTERFFSWAKTNLPKTPE